MALFSPLWGNSIGAFSRLSRSDALGCIFFARENNRFAPYRGVRWYFLVFGSSVFGIQDNYIMEYCLDSELMILEVEKYPYLYDLRHNDFKNRELKKDAWMAVTKNVIEEKWDQMDEKTRSNVGK
ncbi:hypothetical protein AVEN_51996-1 [Araneus ventricosus]|uniref:MADF domain-containing protein n=1 Tax=Araneus ventricosus TaxID=182803 RepID=A0A4Y2CEG0_ARAVE|nr:hypothetical protein AVEN_51996-1 [Araneus ventricosus]